MQPRPSFLSPPCLPLKHPPYWYCPAPSFPTATPSACSSRRIATPARCFGQVVSGAYDKPFVIDDGTTRSLHFSLSLIQSTMSLKDPFALELDYTQAMMSFLLFLPKPRHILMLGLGGGSLAKFCYRHVGSARITVVEIDPRVIAFRDEFELPPDDERLQVREGDGADAVIESGGWDERPDVIMMDAFDRHGLSGSVSSSYFYQTVHDALAGRGLMVANLAGERADRAGPSGDDRRRLR
jgi:spermidine synthase